MSHKKDIPTSPPKAGKDTVYIDVDDEITSIIDKVENAKEKVVALVLPKRAATLQSIVNMRLLKRAADNDAKNVVLITSEQALLPLAGAAGLHVAKNLQTKPVIPPAPGMPADPAPPVREADTTDDESSLESGELADDLPIKISYDQPIGELAAAHEIDNPETIEIGDDEEPVKAAAASTEKLPKAPKDKALKVPNFDRFRLWLAAGILGLIALIVFIFMAVFVLPKATITITTGSTPVSTNLTLTTSDKATALDMSKKVIPAVLKTSEQTQSQQVQATGQQNNGAKATGTMTFYNCNQTDTLSGTNRTVPAGAGVSANGLTYITQQAAVVPPSHFIGTTCKNDVASNSVNVVAQSGGAKYNQEASSNYTVSGYATITGNGSKMAGGTDDIKTIVSQTDVDGAKQKITSASSDSFSKSFQDQLGQQGFYVLVSTLKLSDAQSTASPDVGQAASNSNVTVKITYSVLVVKKDDLTKAIRTAVSDQIDKTKQKVEDTDLIKGAQVTVSSQASPTNVTLSIIEDAAAVPLLNETDIKKQAGGQKSGDITASISTTPGVKSVKVKMQPFWVSKAPKKASKINVIIHHVVDKNG